MRVMLDTNILISTLIFRSKLMSDIIQALAEKHTLVLCLYVIDELHETVTKKFNAKTAEVERFLSELPFEFVYTPYELPSHNLFSIRDSDDEKVLYSAIISTVIRNIIFIRLNTLLNINRLPLFLALRLRRQT